MLRNVPAIDDVGNEDLAPLMLFYQYLVQLEVGFNLQHVDSDHLVTLLISRRTNFLGANVEKDSGSGSRLWLLHRRYRQRGNALLLPLQIISSRQRLQSRERHHCEKFKYLIIIVYISKSKILFVPP